MGSTGIEIRAQMRLKNGKNPRNSIKRELFWPRVQPKCARGQPQAISDRPRGQPRRYATKERGSTAFRVWPRSSDAIDALSDAMRAPAHHKTGPRSTVGVPRAPRTTSPAQNAGNHRTAAAASRSTRDELRASRALVRETTGPAADSGS